jgi:hypothetical protein
MEFIIGLTTSDGKNIKVRDDANVMLHGLMNMLIPCCKAK